MRYKPPPSLEDIAAKDRSAPIPILVRIAYTPPKYMALGGDSTTSKGYYRAIGVVCKPTQDTSIVVKRRRIGDGGAAAVQYDTNLLEVSPDLYDKLARLAAGESAPARNLEVLLFGDEWPGQMDSNGLVDKKFFGSMDRDDDGWWVYVCLSFVCEISTLVLNTPHVHRYDYECFAEDAAEAWTEGYADEHGVAPLLCGGMTKVDQYTDREQEIFQMCISMMESCTPYHMLCAVEEMQRIQASGGSAHQALSITINGQGPEGARKALAEYDGDDELE